MRFLRLLLGVISLWILFACSSGPASTDFLDDHRVVTVYVLTDHWDVFTEKMLLAQADAYSDWTDFYHDRTGALILTPQGDHRGRMIEKKDLGQGLWEVRLQKLPLVGGGKKSFSVKFNREETGDVLPSVFALQKGLKNENKGQCRVVLMNAWPDGRFEALIEIR